MTTLVCSECGGTDIVLDSIECSEFKVCRTCGATKDEISFKENNATSIKEGQFVSSSLGSGKSQYSSLPFQHPCTKRLGQTRETPGKLIGLRKVRELAQLTKVKEHISEDAQNIFKKAYGHILFIRSSIHHKEVLAGCSLYVACRQSNYPVTIRHLCSLLSCSTPVFNHVYKKLTNKVLNSNVVIPCLTIKDCVPGVLSGLKIDTKELEDFTFKLIDLAKETWLTPGRHFTPMIEAAVYFAWKSSKQATKEGISLKDFCKLAGIVVSPALQARHKELTEMLLKLAKKIPWANCVKQKDIHFYIEDILNYQATLLSSALKSEDDNIDDNAKQNVEPPCLSSLSRKRSSASLTEEITYEEDFSDSEIEQYLRTPSEIEEYQNARMTIEPTSNPKKKRI